jgi:DNA-binding beta-propeller fold protein YncE
MFNPFSGQYLEQFGTQGTGIGQLNNPGAIGVDFAGNVWVSDAANGADRIQIFSTVPEPASFALASVGLMGLIIAARRGRDRS